MIGPGMSLVQRCDRLVTTFTSTYFLQMFGFGTAPKKGNKKESDAKLKSRKQWDCYYIQLSRLLKVLRWP
jgi:hypothetical protein